MATINWHDNRTLKHHMLAQYGDFNAFQLMRLLLSEAATHMSIDQRLRFKADLSSAFPANEFSHLRVCHINSDVGDDKLNEVIEIASANFCIASVLGPLPEPFTEWVRDLVAERIPAMADFLDIFNQRINVLRFELKQKQILALNSVAPGKTDVAQSLAAIMGLGIHELAQQVPLPRRAWLGLAGLIANRRKNAATAVHVLKMVLQANVKLTPFVGGWHAIEVQDRTKLGVINQGLGQSSLVGQRVWDQHARIGLEIDSLSYASAYQLLPPNQLEVLARKNNAKAQDFKITHSYFSQFSSLLKLLLDDLVDCEIVIRVAENTVPLAVLVSKEPKSNEVHFFEPDTRLESGELMPMRLGQTAWLKSNVLASTVNNRICYLLRADDMMRAA